MATRIHNRRRPRVRKLLRWAFVLSPGELDLAEKTGWVAGVPMSPSELAAHLLSIRQLYYHSPRRVR